MALNKTQLVEMVGKIDTKIDELMRRKPVDKIEARKIQKSIATFNKTRDRYQRQILN